MRRLVLVLLLLGVVVGVALLAAQTAGRSDAPTAGAPETARSDSLPAGVTPAPQPIEHSGGSTATSTLTTPGPYAPSAFGLSDRVGGYKVLAIFTQDTLACMRQDEKRLVLQSAEPSLDGHLESPDPARVMPDLRQQGVRDAENWTIEIVGPGSSIEQTMQRVQRWNEAMADGCVQFHPLGIVTPAVQDASDPSR